MTREEALQILDTIPTISEQVDALEMAIQALNSLEEVYAKGYNDGFTQAEVNFENDKALSQEPTEENLHREREQAYMQGYEDASKRFRQEPTTRDVVGYEGLYTVDIFGNVFNADGKPMKQRTNEWGYFDIGLSKNNKQSRFKVHRLVAQAFIPNPQNKEQVNHIDGNKKNNAVWNLEWVTPKENTQHSIVTELRKTKIKDLTGKRFGNLVVKRYLGDTRKAGALRHLWECQCDCGKVVTVIDNNLITGHAQSCGCQKGARKWRNPLNVMMR